MVQKRRSNGNAKAAKSTKATNATKLESNSNTNGSLLEGVSKDTADPVKKTEKEEEATTSSSSENEEEADSEREDSSDLKKNGHSTKPKPKIFEITEAPDWPSLLIDVEKDVGKSVAARLFHWGPSLALGIIFTIGLTTMITHLEFFPITEPLALLNFSIFFYFNYGVILNLVRASYTGGGYVTKGWRPPNSSDARKLQYCATCEGYKAPRAHHCKKCNRCVMKMDHHCPWVNNCVGHRNHSYFIKFLAFAVAGCFHAMIILGFILYHTLYVIFYRNSGKFNRYQNFYVIRSLSSFIFVLLAMSFSVGVIIAVGVLLFYQMKGVLANKTAIEDYICAKVAYRGGGEEFTYPYDLGWKRNFCEIFPSIFSNEARGNGVWWPVRSNCSQFTLSKEQLIQKTNKRYAARIYEIIQDHKGGIFGAWRAGFKTFFCQPCSEESRIALKKGEAYAVTRINKHWIYGQRLIHLPPTHANESDDEIHGPFSKDPYADRANQNKIAIKQALEPRGWFPKNFAKYRPRPKADHSN